MFIQSDGVYRAHSRAVRYVPDWFPGTGWKVKGKRFAKALNNMADMPHQYVKDQMVSRRLCGCVRSLFPLLVSSPLHPSVGGGVEGIDSHRGRTLLGPHRHVLVARYTDIHSCRLLEWPFRRSLPNCLAVRGSPQKPRTISSGQPLRYMEVRSACFAR